MKLREIGKTFGKININFELKPFSFRLSKIDGYGISFLGFGINRHYRAIGFNVDTYEEPNCVKTILIIYFYGFMKKFTIKTKKHNHFVCNICGNPVWKHNLYCQHCRDEMEQDEVTWVSIEYKQE